MASRFGGPGVRVRGRLHRPSDRDLDRPRVRARRRIKRFDVTTHRAKALEPVAERIAAMRYNWDRLEMFLDMIKARNRHDFATAHELKENYLEHTAWGVTGSFFLTGEKAGFRSPTPRRPFDLEEHGFGALELVGRYGELELDEASFPTYATISASARKASSWGVGLNWHFTRAVRFAVNYERTSFRGGAPTGDRERENAVITRFQTSF
jgi:phosphate-selective porin